MKHIIQKVCGGLNVQGKAFVQKVIKWLTAVKNVIAGKLKPENIIVCANVRFQEHCMKF